MARPIIDVYTQSHMDYVAAVVADTYAQRERIAGLRMVWQQPPLRHFTARFEPLTKDEAVA